MLRKRVFGLPAQYRGLVSKVTPDMPCFLFNEQTRRMFGLFRASTEGGWNLEPYLCDGDPERGSPLPCQVHVRQPERCTPVYEVDFQGVLKDAYYKPGKFTLDLSYQQVVALEDVFRSSYRSPKPPFAHVGAPSPARDAPPPPSLGPGQRPFSAGSRRPPADDPYSGPLKRQRLYNAPPSPARGELPPLRPPPHAALPGPGRRSYDSGPPPVLRYDEYEEGRRYERAPPPPPRYEREESPGRPYPIRRGSSLVGPPSRAGYDSGAYPPYEGRRGGYDGPPPPADAPFSPRTTFEQAALRAGAPPRLATYDDRGGYDDRGPLPARGEYDLPPPMRGEAWERGAPPKSYQAARHPAGDAWERGVPLPRSMSGGEYGPPPHRGGYDGVDVGPPPRRYAEEGTRQYAEPPQPRYYDAPSPTMGRDGERLYREPSFGQGYREQRYAEPAPAPYREPPPPVYREAPPPPHFRDAPPPGQGYGGAGTYPPRGAYERTGAGSWADRDAPYPPADPPRFERGGAVGMRGASPGRVQPSGPRVPPGVPSAALRFDAGAPPRRGFGEDMRERGHAGGEEVRVRGMVRQLSPPRERSPQRRRSPAVRREQVKAEQERASRSDRAAHAAGKGERSAQRGEKARSAGSSGGAGRGARGARGERTSSAMNGSSGSKGVERSVRPVEHDRKAGGSGRGEKRGAVHAEGDSPVELLARQAGAKAGAAAAPKSGAKPGSAPRKDSAKAEAAAGCARIRPVPLPKSEAARQYMVKLGAEQQQQHKEEAGGEAAAAPKAGTAAAAKKAIKAPAGAPGAAKAAVKAAKAPAGVSQAAKAPAGASKAVQREPKSLQAAATAPSKLAAATTQASAAPTSASARTRTLVPGPADAPVEVPTPVSAPEFAAAAAGTPGGFKGDSVPAQAAGVASDAPPQSANGPQPANGIAPDAVKAPGVPASSAPIAPEPKAVTVAGDDRSSSAALGAPGLDLLRGAAAAAAEMVGGPSAGEGALEVGAAQGKGAVELGASDGNGVAAVAAEASGAAKGGLLQVAAAALADAEIAAVAPFDEVDIEGADDFMALPMSP